MNPMSSQQDIRSDRKSADGFLLKLAVLAILASGTVLYLLNITEPGLGNLVLIAGVGGVVGSSLSPLLEARSPLPEQRSEKEPEGLNEARTWFRTIVARDLVRLLVHATGGFGLAAAAFVVTSALLSGNPGSASSAFVTAAFGGGVGFLAGREINRISLRWWSDEAELPAAVIAAIGELEDQVFGRPLLNYDGYAVASWQPSSMSSEAIGKIRVYLEARKVREEREDFVDNTRSESETETTAALRSEQEARVLIQGGRDAPLVPFAVSIVSGTFDVQPYRLTLATPVEGISEVLEFTLLDLQRAEEDEGSGAEAASRRDSELPETAAVLIDVSQAGQTVQLFEMRISPLDSEPRNSAP
jgi:hypothetical protein